MKHTYIKLATSIGLIAILTLQAIWLYNTYSLIKIEITNKANALLENALNFEACLRFEKAPKGTEIVSAKVDTNNSVSMGAFTSGIIDINEGLTRIGFQISLNKVDSIYSILLNETHLSSRNLAVNLISTKDQKILQTTSNNKISNAIETDLIYIRSDKSEAVQATLLNPYWILMQRMGLLMMSTAILTIFVVGSIIYQIKIINRQNKIAKMREDFTYAMIHDMKTPLTSILMGAHILHSGKIDHIPEKREEHFRIVEDESAHLLTLADKVLTISKMEQHTLVLNKEFVLLEPITADLIEKFTAKAEKEIHFSTQLLTDRVYAEADYLKEAISNLIDNAIKYSKESIRVEISTEDTTDGYTLIRVKDYGIGIAPADQKKVFDKFERAAAFGRSKRGGASGFGIGLSYVMSIIDAHGGRVLLESIEGEYTEFQLFIPQFKE